MAMLTIEAVDGGGQRNGTDSSSEDRKEKKEKITTMLIVYLNYEPPKDDQVKSLFVRNHSVYIAVKTKASTPYSRKDGFHGNVCSWALFVAQPALRKYLLYPSV